MNDGKILIGNRSTSYSFTNGTRVITLTGLTRSITDISKVFFIYNETQKVLYYAPDASVSLATITGTNQITIDASFNTLTTGDLLKIIIWDEYTPTIIVNSSLPSQEVVTATAIALADKTAIELIRIDVSSYNYTTFLFETVMNNSEGVIYKIINVKNNSTAYTWTDYETDGKNCIEYSVNPNGLKKAITVSTAGWTYASIMSYANTKGTTSATTTITITSTLNT